VEHHFSSGCMKPFAHQLLCVTLKMGQHVRSAYIYTRHLSLPPQFITNHTYCALDEYLASSLIDQSGCAVEGGNGELLVAASMQYL
jgi:hypothetical protein